MSVQIDQEVAEFIQELLCNAGWIDSAEELILDEYDNSGYDNTLNHVRVVDKTIQLINQLLPKPINNIHSMEDELNECVWNFEHPIHSVVK